MQYNPVLTASERIDPGSIHFAPPEPDWTYWSHWPHWSYRSYRPYWSYWSYWSYSS